MKKNQHSQTICCYCFEIDRGMQVLGWLVLGNCGIIALESLYLLFNGYALGLVHIGINASLFVLGYFYIRWFMLDSVETRQRVKLGLLIWMVFTMVGLALVFIILLTADPKKLPVSLRILDEEIWPGKNHTIDKFKLIVSFSIVGSIIFGI